MSAWSDWSCRRPQSRSPGPAISSCGMSLKRSGRTLPLSYGPSATFHPSHCPGTTAWCHGVWHSRVIFLSHCNRCLLRNYSIPAGFWHPPAPSFPSWPPSSSRCRPSRTSPQIHSVRTDLSQSLSRPDLFLQVFAPLAPHCPPSESPIRNCRPDSAQSAHEVPWPVPAYLFWTPVRRNTQGPPGRYRHRRHAPDVQWKNQIFFYQRCLSENTYQW